MSVAPPRGEGRVRLLEIPGVDLQACGGTHVKNTAEIGKLVGGAHPLRGQAQQARDAGFLMSTTPERRLAAVMYAELRNFTRLSEVLQPDRVLALANEFFAFAAKAAQANDGMVVMVHNDTVLAALRRRLPGRVREQRSHRGARDPDQFAPIGERWKTEYGLPPRSRSACTSARRCSAWRGCRRAAVHRARRLPSASRSAWCIARATARS
jgi:class 3 adenylate cyclase